MRHARILGSIVFLFASNCSAQSLQLFNALPPDWSGKFPEAYDIRLLDVSNDGRTAVGFVCHENIRNGNGKDGSKNFLEDRLLIDTSGDFEPFVLQDGHITYLPVPPNGDSYGGYANRISRDGKQIAGGRRMATPDKYIDTEFDTALWDAAGNYTDPGIAKSRPTGLSADGSVVCGFVFEGYYAHGYLLDGGGLQEFADRVPYDITPDGTTCAWTVDDGYAWYSISADASVEFGIYSPNGCVFTDDAVRKDESGTEVLAHGPDCSGIHFIDSNPDGSLAVGRRSGGLFDFGSVSYVWTSATGVQEFGAYLQTRGVDLWQYLGGDDHLVVTAMNDDATVFVGYIKGTGRQFGGTGRDTAWIADLRTGCYPDLAPDGTLDLFDFLAFVNLFNDQSPSADCDENGALDLFDFLCFVNSFNAGC